MDKMSVLQEAVNATFCSIYWEVDGCFHELHSNTCELLIPGKLPNTFTSQSDYVQVLAAGVVVAEYGSYIEQNGKAPDTVWSKEAKGDGTFAKLVLRNGMICIARTTISTRENLPCIEVCDVAAVLGVSILHEYGEKHRNYDLR